MRITDNNQIIYLAFTLLALACFGLSPIVHAVTPAPDGGYPGGNTAEGQNALLRLTTGGYNAGIGWLSLESNMIGSANTGVGAGTLALNTADGNTAIGAGALLSNTTGSSNTANGAFALFDATTGSYNTASGFQALFHNITGIANTAVGFVALGRNTTGTGNIALGNNAGIDVFTADNVIAIGHPGQDVSNTTWVGNIYNTTTVSGTTLPVVVSDTGQLGTMASSKRFKKDIGTMNNVSEAILALRPVTFHYTNDAKRSRQFGLIAEEVAEVNPDLVVRDEKGEIYTVRYDAVNAMLLNEFLKEHRKVEQLEATVARQQLRFAEEEKQIAALTSGLQKVSSQLETSKTATQVVVNSP